MVKPNICYLCQRLKPNGKCNYCDHFVVRAIKQIKHIRAEDYQHYLNKEFNNGQVSSLKLFFHISEDDLE